MASPIQMLRDGILSENWSLVREAYSILSGEELPVLQPTEFGRATDGRPLNQDGNPSVPPADYFKLPEGHVPTFGSGVYQHSVPEPKPPEKTNPLEWSIDDFRTQPADKKPEIVEEDGVKKNFGRKEPLQKFAGNSFFDDMVFAHEEVKADIALAQTSKYIPPRPAVKYYKCRCRVCGREENVKQHFVVKRLANDDSEGSSYVCNHCQSTGVKSISGKY